MRKCDTSEKQLIYTKNIAVQIHIMGGPDYTDLPDQELIIKIRNIVTDFSEAIIDGILDEYISKNPCNALINGNLFETC